MITIIPTQNIHYNKKHSNGFILTEIHVSSFYLDSISTTDFSNKIHTIKVIVLTYKYIQV